MPDPNDNDDKTVKDLLESGTRADLERWFGLPSFEQLAEQGLVPAPPPPEDAETVERRKRQDEALAAVDPAWLEAFRLRVDAMSDVIKPLPPLALRVDPGIARFDEAMLAQRTGIAEPRELEPPPDLEDALQERTPQALLRDLHRPESDFYKVFERVDVIAEYRVDAAAAIAEVMRQPTGMPRSAGTPFQEIHALLREVGAERRQPWSDIEKRLKRVTE